MLTLRLLLVGAMMASAIARDCHDILPGLPWLGQTCDIRSGGSRIVPNVPAPPSSGPPGGEPGGDDGGPGNGHGHGHGKGHDKKD